MAMRGGRISRVSLSLLGEYPSNASVLRIFFEYYPEYSPNALRSLKKFLGIFPEYLEISAKKKKKKNIFGIIFVKRVLRKYSSLSQTPSTPTTNRA